MRGQSRGRVGARPAFGRTVRGRGGGRGWTGLQGTVEPDLGAHGGGGRRQLERLLDAPAVIAASAAGGGPGDSGSLHGRGDLSSSQPENREGAPRSHHGCRDDRQAWGLWSWGQDPDPRRPTCPRPPASQAPLSPPPPAPSRAPAWPGSCPPARAASATPLLFPGRGFPPNHTPLLSGCVGGCRPGRSTPARTHPRRMPAPPSWEEAGTRTSALPGAGMEIKPQSAGDCAADQTVKPRVRRRLGAEDALSPLLRWGN